MIHEFWKSAGRHLCTRNKDGWLDVTADFLCAYYTRPEVHPIDESCDEEHKLFEEIMADPFCPVGEEQLGRIIDTDAADNYRIILKFRDYLVDAGTLEGAYLKIMSSNATDVPPLFLDQMVHLILANILREARDPMRLKAAEIFFREQKVSTENGMIILADEEIVEMHAQHGGAGGLGRLLVDSDTPMKNIELDVLDEDNKDIYWERSDRFDTVIDFRFMQPGLDAFARVIEAWIRHFQGITVRVQPRQSVQDDHWSWHVGMDRESTDILNSLYEGQSVTDEDMTRLVALFRMDIEDRGAVMSALRGNPVYLGLAMTSARCIKMKPQNLLTNLPLQQRT